MMVLIFIGSSIPLTRFPQAPQFVPALVHFFEFFILAALVMWATNGGFSERAEPAATMTAFIIAAFYGVTDELHQLLVPGRIPDMVDLLIDTAGAAFACLFIAAYLGFKHRKYYQERENTDHHGEV